MEGRSGIHDPEEEGEEQDRRKHMDDEGAPYIAKGEVDKGKSQQRSRNRRGN